ncbi:MAG TPA: hypothetical protein VN714_19390 [Trebonia sp.]|jgi:hypothetical protein|nr:hypothetical protein [Trebonia sp.]
MVHAAVRAGRPAGAVVGRIRQQRLDLAATPGRLWLLLIGLVTLCLAWGALSAYTAQHYSSAASSVVNTREQLSLDAQQIYSHLSDANDATATAFLAPGPESAATRTRYTSDIAAASSGIEQVTADGGVTGTAAQDLAVLAKFLPTYTQEIGDAEANNRLGLPLGAAYLRDASGLMRGNLLTSAKDLYAAENASLSAASAQATGLPLIIVTLVVGVAVGFLLYRASRWLRGRTNRVLNVGLVAAGTLLAVSVIWLAAAFLGARSDLLSAQARGSATVEAVAQASITAQEAHADESLTLIDNTGRDSYEMDFIAQSKALGPGDGTLLAGAAAAAAGTPAGPTVTTAASDATAWFADHTALRALDDHGQHPAAVNSALGTGAKDSGAAFTRLADDFAAAIHSDQAVFNSTAPAAASAYAGVVAATIAAALLMAAACVWGLSRRIAEYR